MHVPFIKEGVATAGDKDIQPFPLLSDDGKPVLCRRSRLSCKGAYICSAIDRSLLSERYELDPTQLQDVATAVNECRAEQGTSSSHMVAA